jgi:hypothetical protein
MPTAYIATRKEKFFVDVDGVLSAFQEPQGAQFFTIDWAEFLGEDTIVTSAWQASGVTVSNNSATDTTVTAKITGSDGSVTNKITTAAGETHLRDIRLYSRGQRVIW